LSSTQTSSCIRRKGIPAPIHIAGKKRASKHVTLVTGLETFGIDPKSQSRTGLPLRAT
jgi:translation initiation factor 1 (eIF-1/SUI1)